MNKREFCMLLSKYDKLSNKAKSTYDRQTKLYSEKYNGQRCLWLPSTRGRIDHPWSKERATGLWSRYGEVIQCPNWFTEWFPDMALDGELWTGNWEECRSIVSRTVNIDEEGWKKVRFIAFDSPSEEFLDEGYLHDVVRKNTPFHQFKYVDHRIRSTLRNYTTFDLKAFSGHQYGPNCQWVHFFDNDVTYGTILPLPGCKHYVDTNLLESSSFTKVKLDYSFVGSSEPETIAVPSVTPYPIEGYVGRTDTCMWTPKRVRNYVKHVGSEALDAVVIGWTDGKDDYEGLIGALKVSATINGDETTFSVSSGLKLHEREHGTWKLGDKVKVEYTSLTDAGKPHSPRIV